MFGDKCPTKGKKAWYIALDRDSNGSFISPRQYRKASAPPTLFSGKVYFPVYQPPVGQNKCNQGNAYICVTDDECGTNKSQGLQTNQRLNQTMILIQTRAQALVLTRHSNYRIRK